MKRLLCLFALVGLAALPARAGVSVSFHSGSGYGGYHGTSGSCYGGRGYYGCSNGYRGYYGGCYGAYPAFGYVSYGYAPSYVSYPSDYSSYYGADYSSPSYPPAPPPSNPSPAPQPSPNTAPATTAPMAAGTVDPSGLIHSPYSNTTFKADKIGDGQIFHDPITGQPFVIQKSAPTPAPAPTTTMPTGKLDEFGYVHSPFSTFTFKVQSGNYAQVFHDPFTGQAFGVRTTAPAPVASSTPILVDGKTTD